MRVLVTGGAGFLGSHLVDRCLREGHEVSVLDDLSGGSRENLAAHAGDPRLRFERADVRDARRVRGAAAGTDVVFHLAAAVGVRKVAEDPVDTWSRNVLGTEAVLRAACDAGARCVFASSSEVYGPTADGVLREDDLLRLDAGARRDAYALSKAAGESLAAALRRTRLFPVVVARLFNVVGPRQSARYGMVLPRFAAAAVRGEPLPVHGDGGQARCFLHVRDAVSALLSLATTPEADGLVVNVGSDEERSVLDLARAVAAEAGTGAPIRLVPFAEVYGEGFSDPRRRRPDVSRLRAVTGFRPALRLADAVAEAVAHARAAAAPDATAHAAAR
jgi:UDP-glucose 4-epimerase